MTYIATYLNAITGTERDGVATAIRDVICVDVVGDGSADDTAVIQAAIDSGASSVGIPDKPCLVSSLIMPSTPGFVLYGIGTSSVLKQKAGATGAMIRWATTTNVYSQQTIRDLKIIGTSGSQHCIDTTGAGGLDIMNVYFTDAPAGKSCIYVNGAASTQTHDIRLIGIRAYYSSSAGHSFLRFGPYAADCVVDNLICNGNDVVSYCIYGDVGALNIQIANSHPYNAAVNVIKLAGTNQRWQFSDCAIDHAVNDLVSIDTGANILFDNCYFEATPSGYSSLKLTGTTQGVSVINCMWGGSSGAVSCVSGDSSTTYVFVFGGLVGVIGNFSAPFSFSGANCVAKGIAGYRPYGLQWGQSGVTASAQAQSTTQYLGAQAAAAEVSAAYVVPFPGTCEKVYIAVSATPAAGQTYTFQARKNGSNVGSALTVSNGSFGGTITLGTSFSQYDQLTISSVFSATSGSSNVRWSAEFSA